MKIAIIGYGKMGHMIEEVALSRGHEIVCRIEPTPTLPEGKEIYSPEVGFQSEAFRSADVAIEFTTPATAEENIRKAWAQGVPVVSGSTGINKPNPNPSLKGREEGNKWVVRNKDGKVMLVWSSNYSVGVNIFFEVNKLLAEKMAFQPQYTPSITETHHIHKLDKPSGTAKTLAEQIEETYPHQCSTDGPRQSDRAELFTHEGKGACIPIESIREGEVPGTHEVKWDSEEDTIIITHIAKGRRGFALGAVLAAEKLV